MLEDSVADGLAVPSDVHQALLGDLNGALLALALDLQNHLLLLESQLLLSEFKQRALGQHDFTNTVNHVDAVMILRRRADPIAEIYIEESKSKAFVFPIFLAIG